MMHEPGIRVRIIEDCRPGGTATGLVGTYEGDYPRTVSLLFGGKWIEYMYNRFVGGDVRFNTGEPVVGAIPREEDAPVRLPSLDTMEDIKLWRETSGASFWLVNTNPLIRLPDGSYIWGDECWWEEFAQDDHTLEQAQRSLEEQKAVMRAVFGMAEKERDENRV